MNESQRKWLLYLQEKRVEFEYCNINDEWVNDGKCTFSASQEKYRIQAQPIPNIPDWREVCWGMQDKGVKFKMLWGSMWNEGVYDFENERYRYQICEQPIPEWKEKMTKETKLDPREEIPHRELQIQWHEDMLVQLKNGEKPNLRNWEYRIKEPGLKTLDLDLYPNMWHSMGCRYDWNKDFEYRRKPRTVTYWHCVGGYEDSGGKKDTVWFASGDRHDVFSETERYIARYPLAKFSPITETTVEVEG